MRRWGAAVVSVGVLSACEGTKVTGPRELVLSGSDTLVAPSSELLAGPGAMAVDAHGDVYVADYRLAHVLVMSGAGDRRRVIGRKGGGPGEFEMPVALVLAGDSLRVVDARTPRLQVFTTAGTLLRGQPLPPTVRSGAVALAEEGDLVVATAGHQGQGLATIYDAAGQVRRAVGEPVVPAPPIFNMTAIKAEIREGKVPDAIRNFGLPFFGTGGDVWHVLLAEGVVQRFDSGGALRSSAPLDVPEAAAIKEAFFARNRELEGNPVTFASLNYVSDGTAVGDSAWVLLDTPDDAPSVLAVSGADGGVRARMVLSDVRGAGAFAIDWARRRVYFTVPSAAALVAVALPVGGV